MNDQLNAPAGQALNLAQFINYADGSVVSKTLLKKDTGNITLFAFDNGQGLSEHTAPFDALVYVLDGEGIVEVGEEKKKVEKDSIVHSPAKIVHCWSNESDKLLRIMVAKTPKPKESTILL